MTQYYLICRVDNGSLVYSLVAVNGIKYHKNALKLAIFRSKINLKVLGRGTRCRIVGETGVVSWTTLITDNRYCDAEKGNLKAHVAKII